MSTEKKVYNNETTYLSKKLWDRPQEAEKCVYLAILLKCIDTLLKRLISVAYCLSCCDCQIC
jgi:hypothetical protein